MAHLSPTLTDKLSTHVAIRNKTVQENVSNQVSDLTKAVKLIADALRAPEGLQSFDAGLAGRLLHSHVLSDPAMNLLNYGGDVGIVSKGGDQTDFHLAAMKYSISPRAQGISTTSKDGVEYIREGKMIADDGSVHIGKFSLSDVSRTPYLSEGTIHLQDGGKHQGKMVFHESLGKALLSDGQIIRPDGKVVTLKTVRDDSSKTLTAFVTSEDGKQTKVVSQLDQKTNRVQGTVTQPGGRVTSIDSFVRSQSTGAAKSLARQVSGPALKRPDAEPAGFAEISSLKAPARSAQPILPPNELTYVQPPVADNNTDSQSPSGANPPNNARPDAPRRGPKAGRAVTRMLRGIVTLIPAKGTVRVPRKIRAEAKGLLNSVAVHAEALPSGDRKTEVVKQLNLAREKWAAIGSKRLKSADYRTNVAELKVALTECKSKLLNASHPDKSDDKQRHDDVMNFAQNDLKNGSKKLMGLLEKRAKA